MIFDIRWTEEAELTFDSIYTSIENRWSTATANKFKGRVLSLLDNISGHPFLFPETVIPNIRKAVITKQSSLFYEIHDDHIALVFFWDNRQDPLFY
ncbi:hypothetical protein GCM10023149_45480 [Mucilaginibacter gynuensis]|uniref:Plasmid stabilization system protein ParE n=1 Tax=Mucilaginibacter gynuensis TaxID=1302236 RepID=A0ABP8HA81_9SPHI